MIREWGVGCDAMGNFPNHDDGTANLLRKSSDVLELSSADWADLRKLHHEGNVMTRPRT